LLRGAGPLSFEEAKTKPKNPEVKILPMIGWDLAYYAELNNKETYGGLTKSVIDDWPDW
jgi:hypothetical protein